MKGSSAGKGGEEDCVHSRHDRYFSAVGASGAACVAESPGLRSPSISISLVCRSDSNTSTRIESRMIGPAHASSVFKMEREKQKQEDLVNLPALMEKFEHDHLDEITEEAIELAFTHGILGMLNS